MNALDNRNLILKVCEYGYAHGEFTIDTMVKELSIPVHQKKFLDGMISRSVGSDNPNHLIGYVKTHQNNLERETKYYNTGKIYLANDGDIYSLLPNAFYNYVDYLEIVEARRHADEAKVQATKAHKLSTWALIVSIIGVVLEVALNLFNR